MRSEDRRAFREIRRGLFISYQCDQSLYIIFPVSYFRVAHPPPPLGCVSERVILHSLFTSLSFFRSSWWRYLFISSIINGLATCAECIDGRTCLCLWAFPRNSVWGYLAVVHQCGRASACGQGPFFLQEARHVRYSERVRFVLYLCSAFSVFSFFVC